MNRSDGEALKILLSEVDWLRSLARALVPEADLAEDAAQDAWVAALERRRRHAASPRAWLAQVARNAVRKARRSERRRRDREHWVARDEGRRRADRRARGRAVGGADRTAGGAAPDAELAGLERELAGEEGLLARCTRLQEQLAAEALRPEREASAALAKIERKLAEKGPKSANVKALQRFAKKHAGTRSAARAERMVQLAGMR